MVCAKEILVKNKKIGLVFLLLFVAVGSYYLEKLLNKNKTEKLLPDFEPSIYVKAELIGSDEAGKSKTLELVKGNSGFWWLDGLSVDSGQWTTLMEQLTKADILETHSDFANMEEDLAESKSSIARTLRLIDANGEVLELIFGNLANFGQYVRLGDKVYLINQQVLLSINKESWLDKILADIDAKTIIKVVILASKNIKKEIVLARDLKKSREKDIFFMMNDRFDRDIYGKISGPLPALPYILNRVASEQVIDSRKFDQKESKKQAIELITEDGLVVRVDSFLSDDGSYYWKLKAFTNNEANDIAISMAKYYNEMWQNALYKINEKKQNILIDMPIEKILELKNAKFKR